MAGSNTYFMEVTAHVSLKGPTKVSFRGKKIQSFSIVNAVSLKQKRRSATKNIEVVLISFALLYLVQLYISWK